MIIIRPISLDDFDALHQIAINSGNGLTSFPDDPQTLKERIKHSLRSFNAQITTPGEQGYLFVMQDLASGEVVGTSGIEASVGQTTPLYHHRIESCVHHSDSLELSKVHQTLTLCTDLIASTEICSLYIKDSYRINRNGRALSRFRFLFMGAHQQRFSKNIIAEMRGYADQQNQSPFWSWFEQHFCNISFATSNHYIGIGDMRFASELMPKYPLYTSLMSASARDAINRVHPDTIPALVLLEREGFKYGDYIGVNDAGPAVTCPLNKIKTVIASETKQIKITDIESSQTQYLACNHKLSEFRAAQINVKLTTQYALITAEVAHALNVCDGDWLTLVEN
ncbi:MAG: arginine N-succinyltransferase [Oceanospirillaceae bacterium]|jgi:arginine N-succinyltransferase